MRLQSGHGRLKGANALVRVDHPHIGRFADDDGLGGDAGHDDTGNHAVDTDTAHLLVVGERNVKRRLERPRQELGNHRQHGSAKPLHVGGPATEKPAVGFYESEGIRVPVLAVHRYDVGVARQHDTAVPLGA